MDLITERLDKSRHNRDTFDCGKEALNSFIKQHANNNQKLHISVTHVAVLSGDNEPKKTIYGYYSLSSGQITLDELPNDIKSKLPKYPAPITRIGRLAVDKNHQKQGIGKYLLYDAFNHILESSKKVATFAVVVDAKDSNAKRFYQQYGFMQLQESEMTLFLPIKTVELAIRE